MKLTPGLCSGNAEVQTGQSKESSAQATEEFNFLFSEDNLGSKKELLRVSVSIWDRRQFLQYDIGIMTSGLPKRLMNLQMSFLFVL